MPPPSKKIQSRSLGQNKLAQLNINLPPLPNTTVGSFPKSSELVEMRYKVSQGVVVASELERKEKIAIDACIRDQLRLGLDVLTDGEMNRSDLVGFFAKKIDGFEPGGTVRSYGNRYYKKPVIKKKLSWTGPMTVETWQFAQRATHKPLKAIVTGPYTLMDWTFNEYYNSREAACEDLVAIIKKEVHALADAGAKIIQIDEPALSSRPQEFSLVADALNEITSGLKSYFILHFCYGDISTLWARIRTLPVDNFSIEATNSNFEILPLIKKFPTPKDFSIGVVDSHSHIVESPRKLNTTLRQILKIIPAQQLWLSPDCGLKTRTMEEAQSKIKVMVKSGEKKRAAILPSRK